MGEKQKVIKKKKSSRSTARHCGARLWVDSDLMVIIQSEKGQRKKASFDELLLKEKKKTEELGKKFESTVELRKKKLEQAEQEFKKAFSHLDDLEGENKEDPGEEEKTRLLIFYGLSEDY